MPFPNSEIILENTSVLFSTPDSESFPFLRISSRFKFFDKAFMPFNTFASSALLFFAFTGAESFNFSNSSFESFKYARSDEIVATV